MIDTSVREKYTAVIGLEVHAQLLTKTKIYNTDANAYGHSPNTNVSVITLGHPGTLPKLNKKVVEYAIKMGLACGCDISREQIFDRKNYFYPDLPKGYQLTQDRTPICMNGHVTVFPKNGEPRDITLNRIHIEEDAGKSIHLAGETDSLVDFNRAGVPLIEIVTEPAIRSSEEANSFLTEVRKLVRYLDICDGNMEEGSLRCDANISVMLKGSTTLGKKVEVKNMNSIRNVQRAIDHEIERQIAEIEKGNTIFSETRTFDAATGTTAGMRTKEELNDYRYFPDPDLSPLIVSEEWLKEIEATMPSLPNDLLAKYVKEFNLPEYDAQVLTDTKEIAAYFEALCGKTSNYKAASNWVMGPVKSYLNDSNENIEDLSVTPENLAEIIQLVDESKVSFSAASQRLFPAMLKGDGQSALATAESLGLIQDSDSDSIGELIDEVLAAFPDKVAAYRKGQKGLIGMFMGEVMKKSNGSADPKITNELLRNKLA
ncbi:Asp-tRNA(Asn)/Glu-tRNA(Gln) amidotransferase subunit GatB [Fulvivirga sediminis]|uniref:Aspartyl/glutamyl-tRNA(Asn/Gln) amidotransferase subunit B n=1 Tax=Fulvivirga sediminis TaxID=2803949 RepID=A0A937FBB3_9BACT|nr:Asp-tRNA(Asn)/Glu-tRNA(Gln) amidotransferase subunit GatB [Fulvivirga sediminis]MBL3657333.1 Asp-tRNA(Asn)/Glu-tRNA(Gln) amidotransferase subunit GatB [Fulvivirga sediminis]